jgi:hypothetical protein
MCVCVCVSMCVCVSVLNIYTATLHIPRLLSLMTRASLSLMRRGYQVQRLFDLISLRIPKVYQHLALCLLFHTESYVFFSSNYMQILTLGICN